jgi:general secretion pathway protein D
MLKIELESSELSGTAGDAGSLITNKRSIKTNVLIEDGATVVIAGLIRDAKTEGESRVPFLGRIPLIGEAFRVRSGKREKTNLMVFIRPKILSDGVQSALETNAKYNMLRDLQQKMGQRQDRELIELLPGDSPVLPPAPPLPAAPAPAPADSNSKPESKPQP